MAAPRAIGVDTGGTFTDFVAWRGGRLVAKKLPSTPERPERAVLEGLAALGEDGATRVRHGSTVATNALLERRGARVAFVTTAGFEDLLEIGRQDRPDLYALAPRRVEPLVPESRRFGVSERTGPKGERLRALRAQDARATARRVTASRAESVAVGLLHAYAAPAHERALGRALAATGLPVTLSSALCPEVREYERFATTVVNAYLAPRVARYVTELARGRAGRLEIVLSHGGTSPPSAAAREPARQLLSGPAAGLAAAAHVARRHGHARALTLDVGGTSTDCAFVDGPLPRRRGREIGGFPVLLPLLDVNTVGAGGGSIARVDAGGLLAVGPESAGAMPGPAAYGHGGPCTVTDALLVLGRLPQAALASRPLDRAAARRALAGLARALRVAGAEVAAEGVVAVADARMEAALRRVSVERGHDPRGAALVAFGGAGGLHACALAAALGCAEVLFPPHAGVLSALGALAGGSRRERSRTVLLRVEDAAALERAWRSLERAALRDFPAGERGAATLERWAEVRYRGQSHELSLPGGPRLAERFHAEHARRHGYATPGTPVEVVTVEVRGATPARWPAAARPRGTGEAPTRATVRHEGRDVRAVVWTRAALAGGRRLQGPAVVCDDGATFWLPPRWRARIAADGTLIASATGGRR